MKALALCRPASKPLHVSDLQDAPGLADGVAQFHDLPDRDAKRLLAQDMLAGLERGPGGADVEGIGGGRQRRRRGPDRPASGRSRRRSAWERRSRPCVAAGRRPRRRWRRVQRSAPWLHFQSAPPEQSARSRARQLSTVARSCGPFSHTLASADAALEAQRRGEAFGAHEATGVMPGQGWRLPDPFRGCCRAAPATKSPREFREEFVLPAGTTGILASGFQEANAREGSAEATGVGTRMGTLRNRPFLRGRGNCPRSTKGEGAEWSHPPGSNRRPADYESAALPAELGWPWVLNALGPFGGCGRTGLVGSGALAASGIYSTLPPGSGATSRGSVWGRFRAAAGYLQTPPIFQYSRAGPCRPPGPAVTARRRMRSISSGV